MSLRALAGGCGRLAAVLRGLGYEVYCWEEPPSEPETVEKRFEELVPGLASTRLRGQRLYRHQLEALEALEEGRNVVLTAKTGSGKTEAWALAAIRGDWRVLAVYPTLALSEDQLRRLEEYYAASGRPGAVVRLDRPTLTMLRGKARGEVLGPRVRVVATNPAFLLADLKRYAESAHRSYLAGFLESLDLVVVDELDFYGPRGAHLVLAMLEIISAHIASRPPRVAVLSATLGNPQDLARELTRITRRDTVLVEGRPFKQRNRVILVLGKNAEALKAYIEHHRFQVAEQAPWILEALEDEEEFRERLYEIYEALEAMGLRPPRPGIDPAEVLEALLAAQERGRVTLVFTRSIAAAEKLYRSLRERLPPGQQARVAVHHHLVPKRRRAEIEEGARRGEVGIIITVRTLAQGIDIGTVTRVVHVGLPLDLREYLQREGRKGRRKGLGETETVIIPTGLWDRRLLEAGAKTLREWLSLGLEKLYVNPGNRYAALFKALWRLIHGVGLSGEEEKLLLEHRLARLAIDALGRKRLALTERGKRFWSHTGFYEHGPPYGYRKILVLDTGERLEPEEVSHRDVVEKYQPGFYDPVTEMIVVDVDTRARRIYEKPLQRAVEEHSWLTAAAARYEDAKRAWGEKPDLQADLRYGRVTVAVRLRVEAPAKGFGELVEEPLDTVWLVESRRPRLSKSGRLRVYRELASIELEAPVKGRYRDYTYGLLAEAPPGLTTTDTALGLAALLVLLRLHPRYSLPLNHLSYRLLSLGPFKLIHIWEREAAGLLEKLDWSQVAEDIEDMELGELGATLLAAIDPHQALRILRGEADERQAVALAAAIAKTLAGTRTLRLGGLVLEAPRRSKEWRIAALTLAAQELGGGETLVVVDLYDGEQHHTHTWKGTLGIREAIELGDRIAQILNTAATQGHTIYIYGEDQHRLLVRLTSQNYLARLLREDLEKKGLLRDAARLAEEKLGQQVPLTTIAPKTAEKLARLAAALEKRSPEQQAVEAAKTLTETLYDLVNSLLHGKPRKTTP